MKCLSLLVNESTKEEIIEMLQEVEEVNAYTLFTGEGHTKDISINPFENAADEVMGYVPRIRIDLILPKEAVPKVIAKFKTCQSCTGRRGIYWVSPVEEFGTL